MCALRYLYSFLFYLILPFAFLRLLWRGRRLPAYRQRLGERLGFCPHQLESCIWVHAVSVGETIAAIPLIKALKKTYPDIPLLVTNMTPTGAARVKAAFGDTVLQAYIPYDLPDANSRFIKRVNPKILIILETELWPNLLAACREHHIPVVLTNARLSQKSANGYRKIFSVTKTMLNQLAALSSQGYADAKRFIELGISENKVVVTGNLKFDLDIPENLHEKSNLLRQELGSERLIWIAASTHPSEEEIILEAHKKVKEKYPNALLILVPRHPDRFDQVAQLITQEKLSMVRRSLKEVPSSHTSVYLSDTMGELLLMYSVSDVAFVAGSFAEVGGHNMLEAAALDKPILTGPKLYNFAEISEMLFAAKGMIKVHEANELATEVMRLFADESYRKEVGKNALSVVEQNKGSLKKQMDVIAKYLD